MIAARILILIPHPDDEVVGCCAAIRRACAQGATVSGLYLTDGVPVRRARAARVALRWQEAAKVRELLGLEDAGRLDFASRTLRLHLAAASDRVTHAIDATQAEILWAPAFEGAHQDHDAANALAARFAARLPVWEYAEYNNAGGRARSQTFPDARGGEQTIELAADEIAQKRRALGIYASERGNLRHIDVVREAFRPLPTHDYARPPHPGTLFYARYRWAARFTSRVDRTDPAEVYRSLGAFAALP
jgi:LmbE family N-acetylglucosaminyl deacetylase